MQSSLKLPISSSGKSRSVSSGAVRKRNSQQARVALRRERPLAMSVCMARLCGWLRKKLGSGAVWVRVDLARFRLTCRKPDGTRYSERHLRRLIRVLRIAPVVDAEFGLCVHFDRVGRRWVLIASHVGNLKWDGMPLFFTRSGLDRHTRTTLSERYLLDPSDLSHQSHSCNLPDAQNPAHVPCETLVTDTQPGAATQRSQLTQDGLCPRDAIDDITPTTTTWPDSDQTTSQPLGGCNQACDTTHTNTTLCTKTASEMGDSSQPTEKSDLTNRVHDIFRSPYMSVRYADQPSSNNNASVTSSKMTPKTTPTSPEKTQTTNRNLQKKAWVMLQHIEISQLRLTIPVKWQPKAAWTYCVNALHQGYSEHNIYRAWEQAIFAVHADDLDGLTRCQIALLLFHARRILTDLDRRPRAERVKAFYTSRFQGSKFSRNVWTKQ